MNRIPLDIDKIQYTSDGMLIVDIARGEKGYTYTLLPYLHYAARHPNADELIKQGNAFFVADVFSPYGRAILTETALGWCDVTQTCKSLNTYILGAARSRAGFDRALAPLLQNADISSELRQTLEKLKERHERKNGADVPADAISRLREFRGAEGIKHLTRLLFSPGMNPPVPKLEGSWMKQEYVHYSPEANPDALREIDAFPEALQRTIREGVEARILGMKDALLSDVREHYGNDNTVQMMGWDFRQGTSIAASRLSQDEVRSRLASYIGEINQMPARGGDVNALDFIASGLNYIVLVDAYDADFFHETRRKCAGFSNPEWGNYVAAAAIKDIAVVADILLEEAAHGAIRTFYRDTVFYDRRGNAYRDTAAVPFLPKDDEREKFLRAAINLELSEADKILNFANGRIIGYSTDEYSAEAPVKILKLMAQGKWTSDDRRDFPVLTAFVEKVILADFALFEREGRVQSRAEIARAMEEVIPPGTIIRSTPTLQELAERYPQDFPRLHGVTSVGDGQDSEYHAMLQRFERQAQERRGQDKREGMPDPQNTGRTRF